MIKVFTTEEVCKRYGWGRKTLSRRIAHQKFPSPTSKKGRFRVWASEVLDEYDRAMIELSKKSYKPSLEGA